MPGQRHSPRHGPVVHDTEYLREDLREKENRGGERGREPKQRTRAEELHGLGPGDGGPGRMGQSVHDEDRRDRLVHVPLEVLEYGTRYGACVDELSDIGVPDSVE